MKRSRRTYARLALHLLAPAIVVGCGEPPDQDYGPRDDGRVQLGTTSLTNRNFDGRDAFNNSIRFADAKVAPVLAGRFAAPDISATFDDATGATRTLMSQIGSLTGPRAGTPQSIALDFLSSHASALGLTDADLAGMEVTDHVFNVATGMTNIYYRQRLAGLPVYNAQLQLNIARDGRILGVNNAFVPNIAAIVKSKTPAIGAELAVASAASNLSIELATPPRAVSVSTIGAEQMTRVEAPGLSREPVHSQLMWMPINAKQAALAWRFQIQTTDDNHWFDYTVDADTGKVWTRFDWTTSDSYRAYKEPVESANHSTPAQPADGRIVISNPANATASPLGWHNTGATQFLNTRGNNVHAYDDRDANNAPPATEPQCTSTRDCDFPVDYAQAPIAYTPAAITNLFYWNNLIHDTTYAYGFNEVGGNFQVNNFANGGIGNDDVRAEGQDGGGTNNANFSTPVDGQRPRMQMFEWTQTTPRRDGDMDNGIIMHEYGHGISNRLVGGPQNVSCLGNAQQPGEGISDWFALWHTSRPTDTGPLGRGIGTYALGQPITGPGIRTQRYSTDPAINTWTYASISGMAIPHGVGSVWAQVMWEVYWALRDQHGYSPDLHNAAGTAGNQRAMLYAIQGMKNTICSPTFVNMRDGIIQAATAAHNGEDVCRLWTVFAGFGLGTNAVSGGPNSTSPTNGFMMPASCGCTPQPIANAGPDVSICAGQSANLGTAAQAGHTYSWTPGGATTAQITVTPAVTTTYTVTATTSCGSASDSATVTVQPGGGGGLNETFETGGPGWTTTGSSTAVRWALTPNSFCTSGRPSGANAFYYGNPAGTSAATCTYQTGSTANNGTLTSPPITGIISTSTLNFQYLRQVESYAFGAFDRTLVDVIRSNGTVTNVFTRDSRNASTLAWTPSGSIALSAFAGDTIRLRFTFNTVDGIANNFRGWAIDNVVVTGGGSCLATGEAPSFGPLSAVVLE